MTCLETMLGTDFLSEMCKVMVTPVALSILQLVGRKAQTQSENNSFFTSKLKNYNIFLFLILSVHEDPPGLHLDEEYTPQTALKLKLSYLYLYICKMQNACMQYTEADIDD